MKYQRFLNSHYSNCTQKDLLFLLHLHHNRFKIGVRSSGDGVEEVKQILREIGMISRALDSISNIEFKELDLTRGQYLYVVRICENPGIIQEKLAEMLKVDRTTVGRSIQKLEQKGFIEKRNDEYNRKIKKLFPTDKGMYVFSLIIRENKHSDRVALTGLSEEEVRTLLSLLERVRKNVEVDWEYVKKGNKRNY